MGGDSDSGLGFGQWHNVSYFLDAVQFKLFSFHRLVFIEVQNHFSWFPKIFFNLILSALYFWRYFIGTAERKPGVRHLYRVSSLHVSDHVSSKPEVECLTCSSVLTLDNKTSLYCLYSEIKISLASQVYIQVRHLRIFGNRKVDQNWKYWKQELLGS